ncbi:cyclopropane-fatty-acyl-phospholipid synthase family protein [Massilia sp. TS11]|uniref:SAM-dependent methyltransferase n=1 Tax=Massilia sp. TS11 TaxID=2908003 RepID=UPI001EDA7567|nr:cyclopropane-fatty-acyl-phospholipid synthase family protein [Massilia sp. TS11]MCG2585337.1 cyclopropane-fatty-acyl-phospholipid synthase family protein [Massilia sp. TS11]
MTTESLSRVPAQDPPAAIQIVFKLLARLQHGALVLDTPDGRQHRFGQGAQPVQLTLHDWEALRAAMRSGDIGFAESYIAGHWDTNDLPGLLELLARNRQAMEDLVYGSWWGRILYRLRHLLHRNTRAGSRRNIHAHYDIGNAFYQLWLDPSMTYSSALYASEDEHDLAAAQAAKYGRILSELALEPGARVLEIGCGWGGFAETAARAGMHVNGLTLSTEQLAYARTRLAQAGLAEQATLELRDYRDSEGEYDGIASIEMFEAVGESYWDSYFATVAKRLKSGARACIQTITIDESLFERYRAGTDFIQQYIFPGGMLPTPTRFRELAEAHGLRVVNDFGFGLHYARTLAAWRRSFRAHLSEVRAQGFDERFLRTWEFYLCYCEAAFRSHNCDVYQFTLQKP